MLLACTDVSGAVQSTLLIEKQAKLGMYGLTLSFWLWLYIAAVCSYMFDVYLTNRASAKLSPQDYYLFSIHLS